MPISVNGEFVTVVLKDCAGKKTFPTRNEVRGWIGPLREAHFISEYFADTIHVECDNQMDLPMPALRGGKGSKSATDLSFIYLDVGAWVGSKNKPWGGNKPDPKIKRDFGIVCGPLVLLCGFEYALQHPQIDSVGNSARVTKDSCKEWKLKDKSKEPYKSVAALIECLSKSVASEPRDPGDADIGQVFVREMKHAPSSTPYPKSRKDWVIHVIIGDMHIPVLDKEIQTYGEPSEATRGMSDHSHQTSNAAHPSTLIVDFVPRLGRLDLGPLEAMINSVLPSDTEDGTEVLRKLLTAGRAYKNAGLRQAYHEAPVWDGVLKPLDAVISGPSDPLNVKWGKMERSEAERWYRYYREPIPTAKTPNPKPADIFENAGTHFLQFMMRLSAYADMQTRDRSFCEVKFCQLGDMVDFWVGFACHYDPSSHRDQAVATRMPWGEKMLRHWAKNLFSNTEQGKHVANAVEMAEEKGLDPVFLYGNHDNYLGAGPQLKYGKDTHLAPRTPSYDGFGLFMEHGHQWEPSNADNAKNLPVVSATLVGEACPLGLLVTQAAFLRPFSIRMYEGKVAGLAAEYTSTYGQRLEQILGAVNRFFGEGFNFYCYVMGHTHEACLSTVAVRSKRPDPITRFMNDHNRAEKGKVFILSSEGAKFDGLKFIKPAERVASVTVEWREMMGAKDDEWISLEDPLLAVPGSFDKAVKGLTAPNAAGQRRDTITFQNVPPGLYEARFYLTRTASQPFRRSTQQHENQIAVEGISIQGDAEQTEGWVFEHNELQRSDVRIILRWAFPKESFKSQTAGFALYRAKELTEVLRPVHQMASGGPPTRPRKLFLECDPTGALIVSYTRRKNVGLGMIGTESTLANTGVWELDSTFKRALAAEPLGKWQIRAFSDFEQLSPIGTADIEIVEAKPHGKKKPA